MFGNIGPWELILILVIALIIFGPGKLPDIGKSVGRAMNEFKRASTDLKYEFNEAMKPEEPKQANEPKEADEPKQPEES